jgi:hypothetical protein
MLYDGKKPEELTQDELEAAAVYCARMKMWAAQVFEQNDAAIQELSEEHFRRKGVHLDADEAPTDATIS